MLLMLAWVWCQGGLFWARFGFPLVGVFRRRSKEKRGPPDAADANLGVGVVPDAADAGRCVSCATRERERERAT